MSVTFDTPKFVEKLEGGGFSHAQAKAASQAFADATSDQLATKADIAAVRADLEETELRLDAKIDRVETRLGAKIEASSANLKVEILRWLVVTQIALAGFIFAAIKFVK